jgi:hypothetical protein
MNKRRERINNQIKGCERKKEWEIKERKERKHIQK